MARINIADRIALTKTIITHAYADQIKNAAQAVRHTSEEAYKAFYGAATVRKMYSLPEGWLATSDSMLFTLDGEYRYLSFSFDGGMVIHVRSHDYITLKLSDKVADVTHRFLATERQRNSNNSPRIRPKDAYYKKFQAVGVAFDAHEELRQTIQSDAKEVFNVLRGMNTVEQIKERWPAVSTYVTAPAPPEKPSTALAPNFDELNKRLNLP